MQGQCREKDGIRRGLFGSEKTISVSVCGIFQSTDLSRAHEDCWLTSPARQSNNGPCGVSSDFRPANRLRPSQALLYLAGALA